MSETPDLISPWVREPDPLITAIVGKLGEELCEAGGICFRILIQGLEQAEPVTGKPNRQALAEELADVTATLLRAVERLGLDDEFMAVRCERKSQGFERWDRMLREMQDAGTVI